MSRLFLSSDQAMLPAQGKLESQPNVKAWPELRMPPKVPSSEKCSGVPGDVAPWLPAAWAELGVPPYGGARPAVQGLIGVSAQAPDTHTLRAF